MFDARADDYLAVSTTFVTEIAKFAISLTSYSLLPSTKKSHRALRRRDVILFAVPAFVYFLNNNLVRGTLRLPALPRRCYALCRISPVMCHGHC